MNQVFDGIRLVSDIVILYMVQMLLHPWLYLVAQMLYANLIAQMLLSIVSGTDVVMPILAAQMLYAILLPRCY